MDYVIYQDKKIEVREDDFLNLDRLGIKDITEIKGLENLRNLVELDLSENNISEIKGLESLEKLEELNLESNRIQEIKGLENLGELKDVNLCRNQITKIKGLDRLINLDQLGLGENKISKIEGLNNLENLTMLFLDHNQIDAIQGLDNLINLNLLYLDYNQISEIKGLEYLHKLNEFNIEYNKIPQNLYMALGGTDADDCVRYPDLYRKYCKDKVYRDNINQKIARLDDRRFRLKDGNITNLIPSHSMDIFQLNMRYSALRIISYIEDLKKTEFLSYGDIKRVYLLIKEINNKDDIKSNYSKDDFNLLLNSAELNRDDVVIIHEDNIKFIDNQEKFIFVKNNNDPYLNLDNNSRIRHKFMSKQSLDQDALINNDSIKTLINNYMDWNKIMPLNYLIIEKIYDDEYYSFKSNWVHMSAEEIKKKLISLLLEPETQTIETSTIYLIEDAENHVEDLETVIKEGYDEEIVDLLVQIYEKLKDPVEIACSIALETFFNLGEAEENHMRAWFIVYTLGGFIKQVPEFLNLIKIQLVKLIQKRNWFQLYLSSSIIRYALDDNLKLDIAKEILKNNTSIIFNTIIRKANVWSDAKNVTYIWGEYCYDDMEAQNLVKQEIFNIVLSGEMITPFQFDVLDVVCTTLLKFNFEDKFRSLAYKIFNEAFDVLEENQDEITKINAFCVIESFQIVSDLNPAQINLLEKYRNHPNEPIKEFVNSILKYKNKGNLYNEINERSRKFWESQEKLENIPIILEDEVNDKEQIVQEILDEHKSIIDESKENSDLSLDLLDTDIKKLQKIAGILEERGLKQPSLDFLLNHTSSERENIDLKLSQLRDLIHEFEVKIRSFIKSVLSKHYDDWWAQAIPLKYQETALDKLNKEKKYDEKSGLKDKEYDLIEFLDFSTYQEIILGKKNYKIFKKFFEEKNFIMVYFREISHLRNKISHNRSNIREEEIIIGTDYIKRILNTII